MRSFYSSGSQRVVAGPAASASFGGLEDLQQGFLNQRLWGRVRNLFSSSLQMTLMYTLLRNMFLYRGQEMGGISCRGK